MTKSLVIGLLNNAALLLALGVLYDSLFVKSTESRPIFYQMLTGLIIGSIGIVIMMTPMEFSPGLIFDTRTVLLCISGFFFGPVPTIMAMAITGGFRLYMGGIGILPGIFSILTSGGLGILWRHFRKDSLERTSVTDLYVFGVIVHIVMLLCMLTLPWPVARNVLLKISIPVMIIYPMGTTLLGKLLLNRHQRKTAEKELLQVKSFTENALNAQNDTFFVFDALSGQAIWWNRAFRQISGYTDEEIAAMKAPDAYYSDEDLKKATDGIAAMNQTGKATVEIALITKTGNFIPTEYAISPIISNDQNRQYIISIGRDISERKKAEAALKESEARFRAITATAVDAIFCKDIHRRYTFVNQAMAKIFGCRENDLIGKTPEEIFDENSAAIISEVDDRTFKGEKVNETRSLKIGNRDFVFNTVQVPMEIEDGKVISISGIVRDITDIIRAQDEKLKLESQLRQSQKLESIGIFSGGIAHDFNNLLYLISGNTELLMNQTPPENKEFLDHILDATQRGTDLVKQLLTFSRRSETNLQTLNLNDEIRRIYKMLERVIPKMIEIRLDLADDLYTVDADPGQMEQVLMNLSLNARDAMSGAGRLIIRTENGTYRNERSVFLKVTDTGHGIDDEALEKIFDPFFTTKDIGKGSGLGLSVIYGIIKGHNGEIFCDSTAGVGTTFTIYLPAAKGLETYLPEKSETMRPLKGTETILVVDDDDMILKLTVTILGNLGYKTLSATSGESALEIYSEKHDDIDLIVLDLGMPGMGGVKCLEKLIQMDPEARVIIASGYSEEGLVKDMIGLGAKASILKPYTIEKFSEIIRKGLEN